MARREKASDAVPDEPGGTLADAINAHLALKKEHGASEADVERERESALAPPRRDLDPSADPNTPAAPPPAREPAAERPPASEAEPPPEAQTQVTPRQTEARAPLPPEPEIPHVEPEDDLTLAEADAAPTAAVDPLPPKQPGPGEVTGTFEFEFGADQTEDATTTESSQESVAPKAPDVLEQTPEFFEETPEYDRLWFEERSPRDFDF
ncbi:MAG: hypothetical protein HY827_05220 [Actinobacteria bacterium]|nr:hypothetical protein [Actinomycetota bacterium]